MAMVDRRGLTRQALPAVAASRAAAKRQTRNHRVVIESVVQEQKKLKTTISFQAKPPPGYTFIPAGNPDLTTALKEASRQANRQIYAVTTSPHHKIHDLSKEVHRIGFHFSSAIVAQVCAQYGITLDSKGVVTDENAECFRQMRRKGQRGDNSDVRKDQITINTEARGAIKDLFPKIPDDDLFTIIKGAFQKGQQKVGTANELPLVRRAQLSVVAHVRHVYTRYDRLLREVGYREARAQVETPTLKKLVEWRGDDDDTTAGRDVLEDVMREVIVLSDDEESDDEADDVVEVVTGRVNGWPLPSHHSVAGTQPLSPRQYDYNSAEEDSAGYRIITQAPRRRRQPDPSLQTGAAPNQYRQSRFSAWDRAREEYRANPSAVPVALVPLSQHDPKFYYHEPEFNFNDSPARLRQAPVDPYTDRRIIYDSRPMQPELVRGRDGALYERVYTQPQYGLAYPDRRAIPQAYVSSHPHSPHHASFYGQDHRDQAISSRVLPSIENGQSSALENGRSHAARTEYRMDQPSGRREDRVQPHALPRNPEIIDLTDGVDAQFAKRQRIEEPHSARRPISDPNSQRHVSGHERLRNEYDISAFETKHDRREIIELSSPRIDRKAPPGGSRIVSEPRKDDLARSRQAHATQSRHVHGAAPTYGQHQEVRLVSPPRFTHDGRIAYGVQNGPVHRPDAEYRPEDPAIRSEDIVARHAAQVLPYHGEDATFSREYMPLNREEPQQPPLFYIDSNGIQRDRDPRMPPPRYVRQ